MAACVPLIAPDHATMVPSSVAKMNEARPLLPPCMNKKSVAEPVLATMPVGAPPEAAPGAGMVTTSGMIVPSPLYTVDTPVWLSATQAGLPVVGLVLGEKAM